MNIVFLEGEIENGSRKENNKRQSKVKEIVEKVKEELNWEKEHPIS